MENLRSAILILAAAALATIAGAFLGWHLRQQGNSPATEGSMRQSTSVVEWRAEGGMLGKT